MAKVAKINHDLLKSRQKQIKFYGSYAEVAEIANVNDAAVDLSAKYAQYRRDKW